MHSLKFRTFPKEVFAIFGMVGSTDAVKIWMDFDANDPQEKDQAIEQIGNYMHSIDPVFRFFYTRDEALAYEEGLKDADEGSLCFLNYDDYTNLFGPLPLEVERDEPVLP